MRRPASQFESFCGAIRTEPLFRRREEPALSESEGISRTSSLRPQEVLRSFSQKGFSRGEKQTKSRTRRFYFDLTRARRRRSRPLLRIKPVKLRVAVKCSEVRITPRPRCILEPRLPALSQRIQSIRLS